MTNQNPALRDPEREPDRLRPPIHLSSCKTEPLDATKRLESEQCSQSPTRLHSSSPSSLPIYARKSNRGDYIEIPASLNSDHTTTSGVNSDERIRGGVNQSDAPDDDEDDAMMSDTGKLLVVQYYYPYTL